jgi:hypothetical protein
VILLLGVLVSAACVIASARRLRCVVELGPIDHATIHEALRVRRGPLCTLEALFSATPGADWERDAVLALAQPLELRPALVGELMTELDFRAQSWSRVPRVCASLASSFGFLLATLSLRLGLADLAGPVGDSSVLAVNDAILDALDVAAVGLVGTALCIAIHYRARASLAGRLAASERLVELMGSLDGSVPDPTRATGRGE